MPTTDLQFMLPSAKLQGWPDELTCEQGRQLDNRQAVHTAAGPLQPTWANSKLSGQATLFQHLCSQVALLTFWHRVHLAASLLLLRWLKVRPRGGQPVCEQAARLHLDSDLKDVSWLCTTHVDGASHPVAPIASPCGTNRAG